MTDFHWKAKTDQTGVDQRSRDKNDSRGDNRDPNSKPKKVVAERWTGDVRKNQWVIIDKSLESMGSMTLGMHELGITFCY